VRVYVVETGCIYEGGCAVYATVDKVAAIKEARRLITVERNPAFPDDHIYRLKRKWWWVGGSSYVGIRIFNPKEESP